MENPETRNDTIEDTRQTNVARASQPPVEAENHRGGEGATGPQPERPRRRRREVIEEIIEDDDEEELELKYGAQHVIKLFVPVSLCMVVVVATVSSITFYTETDFYLLYTPFHEQSDRWQDKLLDAFLNASIVLVLVVSLTLVLICLYTKRCYLIIKLWLGLSSLLLLSFFTILYLMELLKRYNVGIDWITLSVLMWNFEIVGMVCIHWKGPLVLQQAYLIYIASLMSLIFIKYLPPYTLWVVLGVISLWDLVAVLCPRGPLKILVETAQERNEPIFPALIYSSNIMYSTLTADGEEVDAPARMSGRNLGRSAEEAASENNRSRQQQVASQSRSILKSRRSASNAEQNGHVSDADGGFSDTWQQQSAERTRRRREQVEVYMDGHPNNGARQQVNLVSRDEEEERGVKLGLGDFIFYSVLVGKVSSYGDWNTTFACFIAILIGLCLTLIMLAILKKALPALPISITFGLVFFFCTSIIVVPFTEKLTIEQVYI